MSLIPNRLIAGMRRARRLSRARTGAVLAVLSGLLISDAAHAQPTIWPGNGHAYEFVAADHIRWDDAKDVADTRVYQGQPGYLATIMSQEEQDFLVLNFGRHPDIWLGGSDFASEGEWFWVTGPEEGMQFYSAASGPLGYLPPNFEFDNAGNEDYLVWNHTPGGVNGQWNDYGIAGRAFDPPTEPLSGYFVEYGGLAEIMMGDLDCDGDVDFDDISPFVLGLNDPERYESTFGVPPSSKGDIDQDGDFDFDDIQGFVGILNNIELQPVPEPSTLTLAALAILGIVAQIRDLRKLFLRGL